MEYDYNNPESEWLGNHTSLFSTYSLELQESMATTSKGNNRYCFDDAERFLKYSLADSVMRLRQRFQRKSSFNVEGVKWRQSWSSCELKEEEEEEERNQEGEKEGKITKKKMNLKKLKQKSLGAFRSLEDEMSNNSGRAETLHAS